MLVLVSSAAWFRSSGAYGLAPTVSFPTGTAPASVIVRDLTHNNHDDVVVANSGSNTVSVLLGTGKGALGAKTDFATGSGPRAVFSARVNADYHYDLLVVNRASNTVSVLLGNGTGGFGARTDFSTGLHPVAIDGGDINADGYLDLAVTNFDASTVSVLLGTGTGTFGAKTDFATGPNPNSVAIADLDGDNKPDLLVANSSASTLSLLLGDGLGGFAPDIAVSAGSGAYAVVLEDLNLDGKLDVVVANNLANSVTVRFGDGAGGFGTRNNIPVANGPTSIALGEFDGDCKLDIAVTCPSANLITVLSGNGLGGFPGRTDYALPSGPVSVAPGDLRGDGKTDLVVARSGSNAVSVLVPSLQACGLPVSTALGAQGTPNLVSDGVGGALLTWHDGRSGELDVYAQRVDATGLAQWTSDGEPVCTATAEQYYPVIVSDGAQGAIVAWYDLRGTYGLYIQRLNSSGVRQWNPQDGVLICNTANGPYLLVSMVSDGAGGAILSWYDNRNGNDDIYAQRVNASGVPQWPANGVAICTDANSQVRPAIASDGANGAIIAWEDSRNVISGTDLYAQRINGLGVRQWPLNGVPLCTAIGTQATPRLISSSAGSAIAAWDDHRSGTNDVFAQRIGSTGTLAWTSTGVGVSLSSQRRSNFQLAPDSAGGAIVVCQEDGSPHVVLAQRFSITGTRQWGMNGQSVSGAGINQLYPCVVTESDGGAIVFWTETRGCLEMIYGQRLSSGGSPSWVPGGVPVCGQSLIFGPAQAISDGAEGAIVAWTDYLADQDDIYVRHLSSSGDAFVDVPRPAGALRVEPRAWPNPFSGPVSLAFSLEKAMTVRLEVLDVAGRIVSVSPVMRLETGPQTVTWDGRVDRGGALAAGVYFLRVRGDHVDLSRRVVHVR